MTKLEKANNYIKENIHKIEFRPNYHLTPEIGWLNDPNGFSYFKDKYHLFYQFYPYDTKWNDMHWGHATSKDLVTWDYEKVALANDTIADANGCFSGSAIEKDGELYLIYTGLVDPNMGFKGNKNEILQQQCLAYSADGINFTKYPNNPVISQYELPKGYNRADFRDPKVIEKDGVYYVVLAAKNIQNRGEILLYKSLDLIKWDFVSAIFQSKFEENMMTECPDLFTLDGKEVILFSRMPCEPAFENTVGNTTDYLIGSLDFETGIFEIESTGIIDYGHSFYAPQTMENKAKERIMIGWMKKWVNKTIITPEEFGWNGLMSLPRVLSISEGKLLQRPLEEINKYFANKVVYNNVSIHNELSLEDVNGSSIYFKLEINSDNDDVITVNLFKKDEKAIKLIFNLADNSFTYNSLYDDLVETYDLEDYTISKEILTLEIYLDLYTIEIFLNSGEKVFSFTNFTKGKGNEISFKSDKSAMISNFEKYDIIKK